jgi:hypothetical protein
MKFVQLNRSFLPIAKDQQPRLEAGRLWGHKFGGWLDWPDLRQRKRVVLLAEASCGKSDEFRNQVEEITAAGSPAFMVRVEELADQAFEAALEPGSVRVFDQWRKGTGTAWFFLDSVDEARLNRRSFETALKRFARDLDQAAERAHVLISCRVSDWDTARDRVLIERLLPARPAPAPAPEEELSGDPLLDPLFETKATNTAQAREPPKSPPEELLIVQLTPLSNEQCRMLAAAAGVADVDKFMEQIDRNGLDAFTDRPGDVLDLAEYWRSFNRFGSFADMVEHGVTTKLREIESYRGDSDVLSPAKAREGAERIAAAMTFGKSFTLRAPNQDPDPSLASGAIDPALVLEEWTEAQRAALARRGIFAPSTYGRIRFHHRTTQEYLTARWLFRLLESNCPDSEVWSLIFADRYGVQTVIPSVRPAAAWLAIWNANIREEIIRREPALLMDLGDPGSLPPEAKHRLLVAYARKHAAGDLARHMIEDRSLWMFADPASADAIREAWHLNAHPGFRYDLLRLIRDGKITACADLARSIVSGADREVDQVAALDALLACDDKKSLREAAARLLADPAAVSARMAAMSATVLYPAYLTTTQLLILIDLSQSVRENVVEGFPYVLRRLYEATPDIAARRALLAGIGELCLKPPFAADHQQVARKHAELAGRLYPLARIEVQALGHGEPPSWLIRLLMVVERAEGHHRTMDENPSLHALVRRHQKLNRTLFWADVEFSRQHSMHGNPLTRWWQIHFFNGPRLWGVGPDNLAQLREDMRSRASQDDRRVALSAVVSIFNDIDRLKAEATDLRKEISGDPALVTDLDHYLAPPPGRDWNSDHEREIDRTRRERAAQTERDKASWVEFANYLRADPGQLRDPAKLKTWKAGAFRLKHLTLWLQKRTEKQDDEAPRDWRFLEQGFGREVAVAYRDGMKLLWRLIPPKRTVPKPGNAITFSWTAVLSYAGIGLEAAEHPEWTAKLTEQEATRAARHGCFLGRRYPEWMDGLIEAHPQAVVPIIKKEIAQEWASADEFHGEYLNRYSSPSVAIPIPVQPVLAEFLFGKEPPLVSKLERGVRILRGLSLDTRQRGRLTRLSRKRLAAHAAVGQLEYVTAYLALLMLLDPDQAINDLAGWIDGAGADAGNRAQQALGALFDWHDPLVSGGLENASVQSLRALLRLGYAHVRPEHDVVHQGAYSPGLRDRAESARDAVLTILLHRAGADAFRAMRALADDPIFHLRARRFQELAREKAERDSEPPAWTEREIVRFETQWTAPVKTGADLFRVLMAILDNIQHDLVHGDVTSRPLLQQAKDEDQIQNWIVEQINHRSRGRLHAHREAQVALGDKPDVIVASTAAPCEVAVEIKHGGKGWTARQLEGALRTQLAIDYLKPSQRRHGAFVVTYHGGRTWRDPATNQAMTFNALMKWLAAIAETLVENPHGPIEIRCQGIDASTPADQPSGHRRFGRTAPLVTGPATHKQPT